MRNTAEFMKRHDIEEPFVPKWGEVVDEGTGYVRDPRNPRRKIFFAWYLHFNTRRVVISTDNGLWLTLDIRLPVRHATIHKLVRREILRRLQR